MPGKVDVLSNGPDTTITLNGDSGLIVTGGHGANGSVVLNNKGGALRIGLNGDNGSLHFHAKPKQQTGLGSLMGQLTILLDADTGSVSLGGGGVGGALVLLPSEAPHGDPGHATIHVTAEDAIVRAGGGGVNGRFTTRGKDGQPVVELIAADKEAIIGLGQVGRPGRISLYNGQQHEALRIDAATGDISLLNADCAEEFDVEGDVEPGAVVVLTDDEVVSCSTVAYDRRVVGVVSGAGPRKPGIVLDRRDTGHRLPIALLGKVYCWVDASEHAVRVGDLLTTSSRPGHAMRAVDRRRATGSLLGKALRPLREGTGLIPVLVALQ